MNTVVAVVFVTLLWQEMQLLAMSTRERCLFKKLCGRPGELRKGLYSEKPREASMARGRKAETETQLVVIILFIIAAIVLFFIFTKSILPKLVLE